MYLKGEVLTGSSIYLSDKYILDKKGLGLEGSGIMVWFSIDKRVTFYVVGLFLNY